MFRRYLPGFSGAFVFLEGDGGGGGGADPEALKKANFERDQAAARADKLQKDLDALKGSVLTEDDRKLFDKLKGDQVKAEEDKKRAEGKFDELRQQLVDKHNAELDKERKRAETAETKLRTTQIGRAFAGATSLFGGSAESKTILTHDIAESYFAKFVDLDDAGNVVVKNASGQIVLDTKTGKPAAFDAALLEVITGLPNKDSILRGSGKSGSGSSGGGHGDRSTVDYANLTAEQMQDPKVREEAKRRTAAAGGITMGSSFDAAGKK